LEELPLRLRSGQTPKPPACGAIFNEDVVVFSPDGFYGQKTGENPQPSQYQFNSRQDAYTGTKLLRDQDQTNAEKIF
jgi:hypothetical protein